MKTASLDCLKYLVFFFNLLIFICGIAALSVGIWAVVGENSFKNILVDYQWVFYGVYVIIGVGAALFLIGFLGCCGAIKENRCMLGTFFVFVLILFIAQLGGAIYIYVQRHTVMKLLGKSITKYGDGSKAGETIKQGWDLLQVSVKCCGENSYEDWRNNTAWRERNPNAIAPNSCCMYNTTDAKPASVEQCQLGTAGYIYKTGCVKTLEKSINIVVIVVAAILVVELLAMIFACCLYRHADDYGELA